MLRGVITLGQKQYSSQIDYSFNNEVTSKYANISAFLFVPSAGARASLGWKTGVPVSNLALKTRS